MQKSKEYLQSMIEQEYEDLGFESNWGLLFSDYKTMWSPEFSLTFFGLNPGGEDGADYGESSIATDDPDNLPNAYLDQRWSSDETSYNPLQYQIIELYKVLADELGVSHEELMRKSLMANWIPFRTPGQEALSQWDRIGQEALSQWDRMMAFSQEIWRPRFEQLGDGMHICIHRRSFEGVCSLLEELGYKRDDAQSWWKKVGWSNAGYEVCQYSNNDQTAVVVRLPHLSHYKIFSRESCKPAIDEVRQLAPKYIKRLPSS